MDKENNVADSHCIYFFNLKNSTLKW